MKEQYIAHVLEEYISDNNFDAVFGDGWIDENDLSKLSYTVSDYAFADYGINADGKYSNQAAILLDKMIENKAINRQGDEYAGFWFKLRQANKQKYLETLRSANPVTQLMGVLGEEALRRALLKIAGEDGLQAIEEKSSELQEAISVGDSADALVVPASDRKVQIDHNQSAYGEIAEGLDEAIRLAGDTRPNQVSGDQHASILASLKAARSLWESFELSRIQVEVGIIMAIEQASEQLAVAFKMARGTLLVEAIKAFLRITHNADIH